MPIFLIQKKKKKKPGYYPDVITFANDPILIRLIVYNISDS